MKIINGKNLIKMWTDYVPVEDEAMQQITNISKLPFIHRHIAIMPDVHYGIGATVGSVIPTKGAVIPASVGVDIGCGMFAIETSLNANDLPDNLYDLRSNIESVVPVGMNHFSLSNCVANSYEFITNSLYNKIILKHPKIESKTNPAQQLGTLGGGNHFVELCLDKKNSLWIMLHSGSRGIGNRIGTYFIEQAKLEMEKYHIVNYLPHKDLSYLVENTEIFDDYIEAMHFAQSYAAYNRSCIFRSIVQVLERYFNRTIEFKDKAINCHHNYTKKENHFGENVWLTRKGAVDASLNKLGIIPGSMGERSFIVRGLGNKESFNSCSHGAGRVMSRTKAKNIISLDQHIEDTKGVECKKDSSVLDETPKAYKDIDDVMKSQEDLVEIVHELKQILCVKG
ncbi:MAG: RtcB family protein [Candidatus Nitrosocosmicus sp.]|jgi:tRNA-splicing ligase RtcB (3'-phosphate/5'-hydroxy nucleic acid ligase)